MAELVTIGVKISDPRLLGDFEDFLRRATCRVRPAGAATLEVELTGEQAEAQTHLALFVAAWQGLHPSVVTELVAVPAPARREAAS
jgi:hypothetical protein